jgi:Zn-dependent protease with chaperone function
MSNDTATVSCRFCGTQNRFPIEKALLDLTKVVCGNCRMGLLRVNGEPLTNITAEDIAHPWDKEAIAKLRSIPYAEELLKKVMGSTLDKLTKFEHMGGALRVSARQAPSLHRMYLEAAGRLDVDPPPLFLVQSPVPNAYTAGASQPVVSITSALVDQFDERSIVGVLGHELAHVKLGHVLFRTLAVLIAKGALSILNFAGLANIAMQPIKILLFKWYQMSELSADRGELVATGSLAAHVRTNMMLAGGSVKLAHELDVAAFIDQAHEAEQMRENDMLVSISEMFANQNRTHPLGVWRVHHALQWSRTQAFFDLLAGQGRVHALPAQ